MKRGLWFAAGAGAGVYAMARARRLAEAFTVEGLRDRWEAVGLGARMLRDDIAQGQAEKETELRERYGLPPHGVPQLAAPADQPQDQTDRLSQSSKGLVRARSSPLVSKGTLPQHRSICPHRSYACIMVLSSYAESLYSTNTAMPLTPRAASHFKPSVSQPS